jgi:hypothetical protein
MSTPVHHVRRERKTGTGQTATNEHLPQSVAPVNPVPVGGLLNPPPRATADRPSGATGQAARDRATTIRRMSFSRTHLSNASSVASVDAIAAVAKQTGIIDTTKLTAADRVSLLTVLKLDKQFLAEHRPLLLELADEIRADRGQGQHQPAKAAATPAQGQQQAATAAAAPVAMTYDSVVNNATSETFTSQADADKKWATRAKTAGVTSRTVIGNYPEQTRLSLDHGLYWFTTPERLGSELRLLIPVRVAAASPTLPVLMSWDAKGAATVRLAGKSLDRPPTSPTPEALAKYLAGKGVTIEDLRSWTAPQLREFVIAVQLIDKLDPKAVSALEGIVLQYTTKADTTGGDPEEAVFAWHPQNKTPTTFLVRKQAFSEDTTQFVGSPGEKLHCHSTMTLTHELGHAVETHLYRQASHAQATAVGAQATAFSDYEAANRDYLSKVQGGNADILRRYESEQVVAVKNALGSLYEVAEDAINAVVDGLDLVTGQGQHATLPKATIDRAQRLLNDAVRSFADEARKNSTIAAKWQPLLRELVAGQKRLSPILDTLYSAAESVRQANAELETVVHREGREVRSKRLQNFIMFVRQLSPEARERVIGITPYARKEWTKKPRELFAEAYALWLTDKPFLTRVAPEFVEYFGQGMHLK